MAASISIRDLKSKIHHSDEYAIFTFYIEGVLSDNKSICAFAQITREIHIVDDFKTEMFIEADILTSKRINIDFAIQTIKIDSCRSITIFIDSRTRSKSIKRTVKSSKRTILLSRITIQISVVYSGKLSEDRDILFKP